MRYLLKSVLIAVALLPAGTVTLAKLLKEAGYVTGAFGKWGLGAPGSASDPIACGPPLPRSKRRGPAGGGLIPCTSRGKNRSPSPPVHVVDTLCGQTGVFHDG